MKLILKLLFIAGMFGLLAFQMYAGFIRKPQIAKVCPVDAISMENGKAVIDASKCIGCRRCVDGIASTKPSATVTIPEPEQDAVMKSLDVPPQAVSQTQKPTEQAKPEKKSHTVNADKCISCTLCVQACPVNAIKMVNDKAVIDKEKCINCGICVSGNNDNFAGCPTSAISAP